MPDPIPCISLWQPWASLWAGGQKRIETRSWPLRGRLPRVLAVHAAKRFTAAEAALCAREPFRSALAALGYERVGELPLGCVVGLVTVVRVYRFIDGQPRPPEPERSFGDYGAGRYGWVADRFQLLAEPVPCRGMQGVFGWTPPPGGLRFAERVTEDGRRHGALAALEAAAAAGPPAADDVQGLLFPEVANAR